MMLGMCSVTGISIFTAQFCGVGEIEGQVLAGPIWVSMSDPEQH